MAHSDSALAHVWRRLHEADCENRVTFHKIRAHQAMPAECADSQARTHWLGNWHADRLAKRLAVQVDCSEEVSRHRYLKQLAELAGLQREAMALGECQDTPPWPEEWRKPPKEFGPKQRRTQPT
eukprot:6484871-Amphidinium_carterae.1